MQGAERRVCLCRSVPELLRRVHGHRLCGRAVADADRGADADADRGSPDPVADADCSTADADGTVRLREPSLREAGREPSPVNPAGMGPAAPSPSLLLSSRVTR